MYLKTLTLRGFKSFASTTSMRFEPGITCIVGPNGSGKSNVVDAFSWVMGEQGVKPLRGGKMEDVVFAGTSGRPALGRAEVTLTIDNSDGALPIEYSEVTISRLLFRSGQSEYAINGDQCRLLDIAELLSDTGLGREMHVIVGQGQLDEVLNAGPDARRALIEEAAGVLKHRRRKEKAVRKLDAMQANLTRLVDLTGELGRRLKPLGRQAEIARKAAVIQADLRDARLRLLADDYTALAAQLVQDQTDEKAAAELRTTLETALAEAREAEAALEAAEQQHAPRLAAAQEAFFALSGLAERTRGVLNLAQERHRNLSAPEPQRAGRDPEELENEAAELRAQEQQLAERLSAARQQLAVAVADRTKAENALAENERRLAADAKAAAQRADFLARLRGQAEAAASRAAAAQDEAGRLGEALSQAKARAEQAQVEYAALQDLDSGREKGRADLMATHEQAAAALTAVSEKVSRLRAAEHAASDQRAALRARTEALAEAVVSGADASSVLLAKPGTFTGVLGPLAQLLTVSDGAQEAIAAALGAASGSVVVAGLDAAVDIMTALRDQDAGRAGLVIASQAELAEPGARQPVDARRLSAESGVGHVSSAIDLVSGPSELSGAIAELLGDVVVVASLADGLKVLRAEPGLRVVTTGGDVLGAHWARGGSAAEKSLLSLRAAASEAGSLLREAEAGCQRAERQLAVAVEDEEHARHVLAEAAAGLQQADAAAAETSGKLGSLAGRARAARDEVGRLTTAIEAAEKSRQQSLAQAAEAEARLAREQQAQDPAQEVRRDGDGAERAGATASGETGPGPASRQQLADAAVTARAAEMEARLEVRTVEERQRAISGRADSLAAAALAEHQAATRALARAERRAAGAVVASAVADGARVTLARIQQSIAAADADRQQAEEAHKGRDGELKAVRARIRDASEELEKVVDSAHGAQIARATKQLQLEQIAGRALEEFATEADLLVAEYGPDVMVPGGDDSQLATAYDRETQERRAQQAQRQLDQLGKVNPLALEEFAALEERHAFLVAQLEDLKKTRRDLLTVIREVDERVQQVFSTAYADVADEFKSIIARLFPGGDGSLVLTDPDDMLATGIDIEARPPGKKVKRLSLLSGGERSLTAIAFLVAIFRARPSPFYVLDEVEAALDDTNLQRLLEILAELRDVSQLIIVTHQKRTMEVADTLYGISMRGDGVSTVVSQRLRERESAEDSLAGALSGS
ncbi:MAG TPA: chromosome segregation protein SMC [Streptosporangiaceae bacterium]|nr:chromosome segregation protein SMC [Streptosporangiaceae bacterium]